MENSLPSPKPMDYRLQGIAAALGELGRVQDDPALAFIVLENLGFTLDELKAVGAEPYDLEPLDSSAAPIADPED